MAVTFLNSASNFEGLYYFGVAIKISELRCCHGNQKNNTNKSEAVGIHICMYDRTLEIGNSKHTGHQGIDTATGD